MHEDKLTPDQRIRLESVAQANILLGGAAPGAWSETSVLARTAALLRTASRIDRFVRTGETRPAFPGGGGDAA